MKQFLSIRLELILLTGILALIGTSCSSDRPAKFSGEQTTQVAIENLPPPQTTPLPSPIEIDRFELALDKAYGALTISQSAQGAEDWRLIAMQWREAIALMKAIPADSPDKAIAQKKVVQYQQNLKYAQQQANRPQPRPTSVVAVIPASPSPARNFRPAVPPPFPISRDPRFPPQVPLSIRRSLSSQIQAPPVLDIPVTGVFQARIKNRRGGTPEVDVTFNGGAQFEMIVDTGASGTVITQQMAAVLGVVPTGKATADTASERNVEFAIGNIDSIEVGGAVVQNVPVAIAPSTTLDLGLLGQDFFRNYDITIKRDVVEFRPR